MKEQYIQLSFEELRVVTDLPRPPNTMRRIAQTTQYDFSEFDFTDERIQKSLARVYRALLNTPQVVDTRKVNTNENIQKTK